MIITLKSCCHDLLEIVDQSTGTQFSSQFGCNQVWNFEKPSYWSNQGVAEPGTGKIMISISMPSLATSFFFSCHISYPAWTKHLFHSILILSIYSFILVLFSRLISSAVQIHHSLLLLFPG